MKIILYLFLLPIILFEGCMMGGMMMGGMNHLQEQKLDKSGNVLVKQVVVSNHKVEVEFPESILHSSTNYNLKITDLNTNMIQNEAEIWFEVSSFDDGQSNKIEKLISTKVTPDKSGYYSSSFTFHSEKEVQIGFKVSSINGEKIDLPIEIFSKQRPTFTHENYNGISSETYYMIGGAIAMAVMMVFVLMK